MFKTATNLNPTLKRKRREALNRGKAAVSSWIATVKYNRTLKVPNETKTEWKGPFLIEKREGKFDKSKGFLVLAEKSIFSTLAYVPREGESIPKEAMIWQDGNGFAIVFTKTGKLRAIIRLA